MDDDIIRFIVATDNHLGVSERDPVRCNDSFAAFEEVLRQAKKRNVDFILLAGDLFHENKPTRKTLHNSFELFRRYCCGSDPVYIEILNDQREIFKASLGKVNYEDPFHAVSLPVFAIHGNHDDPTRDGGNGAALAALDLLAVSNYVNYFGKVDAVDNIEIAPILIRKDKTKIALYGLGAIRDERLNRMWNQKKVKFIRLTEEQGRDDFFNIFVIHQNRDYGRGKKNCIHESMIPDWMDLVIWGNEHECIPQLQESLVGTYRILQPGSSVACSLSKGESADCPKHMAFFEVKERKFRMKPIKFTQVRQFLYDEISLKDFPELDPSSNKIEELIKEVLKRKVNEMIQQGRSSITEDPSAIGGGGEEQRFTLIDPAKVLIRLKVDHEGYSAINHQRFGAQFVGEVANPGEILLLTRKRQETGRRMNGGSNGVISAHGELRQLIAEGAEDEINRIRIEDLVNETLANSKYSLSILTENEMAQALDDYIIKKIPNAIQDLIADSLEKVQKLLSRDATITDKNSIMKAAETCKNLAVEPATKDRKKKVQPVMDDSLFDEAEPTTSSKPASAKAATSTTAAKGRGRKQTTKVEKLSDADDDIEEDILPPPPPKKETTKAVSARSATRRAAATKKSYIEIDSDEEQEQEIPEEDEYVPKKKNAFDSDDDLEFEEETQKPKRGRKPAKKAAILAEDDESVGIPLEKPVTSTRGRKRTLKEEPTKKKIEEINLMDEDEEPFASSFAESAITVKTSDTEKPKAKKTRQLPLSFSQPSNTSTATKSRFGKAKEMANDWDG